MTTTPPSLTLNDGVAIPVLGLGVFQSPPEETTAAVETAIADGYRLIDTAASYDNEREVGAAIRASGIDRAEMFVTTKLWISDYHDRGMVAARRHPRLPAGRPRCGSKRARTSSRHGYCREVRQDTCAGGTALAHRQGVVAIPKSVKPHRIAENIDVFDFELTADEVAAIDALDTGVRGGPDPEAINMTTYPKEVEND